MPDFYDLPDGTSIPIPDDLDLSTPHVTELKLPHLRGFDLDDLAELIYEQLKSDLDSTEEILADDLVDRFFHLVDVGELGNAALQTYCEILDSTGHLHNLRAELTLIAEDVLAEHRAEILDLDDDYTPTFSVSFYIPVQPVFTTRYDDREDY